MSRVCLVVDDSGVVRKVVRQMLEKHGFTVEDRLGGGDEEEVEGDSGEAAGESRFRNAARRPQQHYAKR